jgi:hypothetical protein
MARGDLIIQQPRVSLISGSELQKASGSGVPVPDLGRPFDRLANDLQRKAEENRRHVSDIEGVRYAEAEFSDRGGKDATGYFKELPALPNGDPYFQAAYLRTRAENARSYLNKDISGSLGRIQLDTSKPAAERAALMTSHVEGALEGLDPIIRGQARTDWNRELEQRTDYMVREEAEKKLAADLRGIDIRFKDGLDMAVSAASTGADYTPELNRAMEAVDDKVRLGIINAEDGDIQKARATEYVVATGTQAEIATHIMDGKVDLDTAETWATSLKSGAVTDQSLTVARMVDTPAGQQLATKTYSSQEITKKFRDPDTAMAVGTRLQEVIGMRRAGLRSAESQIEMLNTLERIAPTDLSLPQHMRGAYNKWVSEAIIESNGLTDPVARQNFENVVEASKVVPGEAVNWMKSTLLGNDLTKALNVVQLWNRISTKKRGNLEVGLLTAQSVDPPDRALLDSAVEYANSIGVDARDPASLQKFRDWQVAVADPNNTPEAAITKFNEYSKVGGWFGGSNWGTVVNEKYAEKYGTSFNMDPRFRREMELTYHVVSGSTNLDPEAAMERAFEMVSGNWQNSEIYEGGIQPTHDPLTNPVTYGQWFNPFTMQETTAPTGYLDGMFKVQKPQTDTAWASDYTQGSLSALDDNNALVFGSAEERAQFDALMDGGGQIGLGIRISPPELLGTGRMQLRASRSNRRYTQFNVVMNMPDGTKTLLKMRDASGQAVPVLLDHGMVLANVNSKVAVRKQNEELRNSLQRGLFNVAAEQYQSIYGLSDPSSRVLMAPSLSPNSTRAELEKFVMSQGSEFQKQWKDSKEKMLKSLKDGLDLNNQKIPEEIRKLPEGTYVPPENLFESRVVGPDVAIAAAKAIDDVLPDGQGGQFLLNIAAMESNFGKAEGTFRVKGDRGITQINVGENGAFLPMVARANEPGDPIYVAAQKLKARYGIDIANAIPSDLDKPIYAMAFARLYMLTDPRPIPADLEAQGLIWKSHYNTVEGDGLVYGTPQRPGWMETAGKLLMPPKAEAARPSPSTGSLNFDPKDPEQIKGLVTDMNGKEKPANFLATNPATQEMAYMLAAAFGQPLRITPIGGTQPDKRDPTSQHHHRTALDIYIGDMGYADRKRLVVTAIGLGYKGVGGYGPGSSGYNTLHVDLRRGGPGPGRISKWWRHQAGVDDKWDSGEKWYIDGINEGEKLLGAQNG